jgi:hypothetical protein
MISLTEREKFWQMLTACTDPRSFSYDSDKRQMKIDLPILPENVQNFYKEIMNIFGNPETPIKENSNPIYFGYKFNGRFIDIDGQTIKYNKYGQLTISEDNIINDIENKVLNKLGIDIKNDEICIDSFPGFNKISQKPFVKNNINFTYTIKGLDYNNRDNWYLFPKKNSGLLDVFILYPTTVYDENKDLIIPITDIEMQKGVNDFLSVIIPIFKDLPVNLYMPKYRQFNGEKIEKYNLKWISDNGKIIRDDIFNAFGYFLRECQNSENFITFSDGQGSLFNYLLATEFAHQLSPEIRKKWANIWAIGAGLDDTVIAHSPFGPSGLPTDLNTIISWNLATESELSKNRKTWGDGTSVTINPVTFSKTYLDQIIGNNISLIKYFKNIFQIQNTINARVIKNQWENEIVRVNINEKDLLSLIQIEDKDIKNESYLNNNNIGIFANNIRTNMISRYNLEGK